MYSVTICLCDGCRQKVQVTDPEWKLIHDKVITAIKNYDDVIGIMDKEGKFFCNECYKERDRKK